VQGAILPNGEAAFSITYSFTPASFSMAVHSAASGAALLFPVISPASEKLTQDTKGEIVIHKPSSDINITTSQTAVWRGITEKRVFNFVPGFEAVPLQIPLNKQGNGSIRIAFTNALKQK